MLQPKRLKYRRPHIVRYEGVATKGNTVAFGEFGLEALEGTWISARQALKLASYKLPIKCRVVSKADTVKESK